MAAVFAMSFLPQFVPEGAPHLPTMLALAAFWAAYEIGWRSVTTACTCGCRPVEGRAVAGVRRRLEQVSGGVLLLLGVRMALAG